MSKVIWKPVKGYEGLYEVSSNGKIRSLFRYKKELKPMISNAGYERVDLFKDKKRRQVSVHRVVAEAFCEKKDGCNVVNHKDECKTNNNSDNLEWVTQADNCKWGTAINRRLSHTDYSKRNINRRKQQLKVSKPIAMYTKDGFFVRNWESASECSRVMGWSCGCIRGVVRGTRKSAYGHVFRAI